MRSGTAAVIRVVWLGRTFRWRRGSSRLLIVEDSDDDYHLIVSQLRSAGYEPQHERVQTKGELGAVLDSDEWDAILSDYHLPGFNAPAALAILQTRALDLPFIIVSGAVGEETAVEAMKVGAAIAS